MIRFLKIVTVILCIGAFISLFQGGLHLQIGVFLERFWHVLTFLINPYALTYQTASFVNDTEYSVFPSIFENYGYTLLLLICGFILSLLLSISLTMLTYYLPEKRRQWFIQTATISEAIPDLFIIVMAQLLFIYIYQETGILVFHVTGGFERPFLLPLLTYSILPTIFLYRTLIIIFLEEMNKPYVELARGKGLTRKHILLRHILRNGIVSLMNHSKMIIAFMLSNLIMVELLYNTYGLTWFILNHPTYEIATIGVLMLFVPLYVAERIVQFVRMRATGGVID